MNITGATALVTGANRGMGKAFVDELLRRGARKVYAAARDESQVDTTDDRVVAVRLDVTERDGVARLAELATDVDLLINNAGISRYSVVTQVDESVFREEMETNYFGTLSMVRAFAPVLAANGGGSILNVSSIMAWLGYEHSNGYGASKAAVWALTNGLRMELAGQNTQVSSLLMASTDTDMMADFDVPKNQPRDIAAIALDGVADGVLEILGDDNTRNVKATLSGDPATTYPTAVRHAASDRG